MNADINERLKSAFHYLISDVIGEPENADIQSCSPSAHALQFLMREAAVADDVSEIKKLFSEHRSVLTKPEANDGFRIIGLASEALSKSESHLFQAAFKDDIGLTTQLKGPDQEVATQFEDHTQQLKCFLSENLPDWWQEFEELVSTIVLAQSEGGRFGGASAFGAWGAILVNPKASTTPSKIALTLIHESSHLKLFHAYLDDEIVLNAAQDLYSSPLRVEARPMNGIFHAAFVLARMVAFLNDLLELNDLEQVFGTDATDSLYQELERSISAFEAAYSVISEHGDLTEKGQTIIQEAAEGVATCKSKTQLA
jgi:hypothetical protein